MFKYLSIEGFRGIKHLTIDDFQQINLFVGKNNCGKTTMLEAIFLLIAPTNPQNPIRINFFREIAIIDENSLRLIFSKLDINSIVKITGELKNPKEKRKLIIKPNIKSTSGVTKTTINNEIDIKDSYSGLSTIIDGLILEYSLKKGNNKSKKFSTAVVRKGPGFDLTLANNHKENLNGVFISAKTISGDIHKRFNNIQIRKQTDKIVKILRQFDPSLNNLVLGSDGIIYCDIGMDRLMPINIMGDGIFRLLSIVLAISDTQNGIVLIDEIENGLHYSSQKILWNAIFESAKEFNVQIFATTHSIECLKAFNSCKSQIENNNDDRRLYRIERKGEDIKIISYDHKTLDASLDSNWEVR